MIKIRKIWLIGLLVVVALVGIANAKVEDVCVIVQDQNGVDVSTDTDCNDIDLTTANVVTALAETDFNPQYGLNSANETILCTVNGLGTCSDPVKIHLLEKGDWKSLSNKKSDLEAQAITDDDVIGVVQGDSGLVSGSVPEMLKIKKITVYIDGDKEDTLDADEILNDESYDVQPGSEVKLKIEFENVYDDDVNIAIEEIEFEDLFIENIDDGDDLDPEDDIEGFDLDAGDKKTVTVQFIVPLLVEDEQEDAIIMEITSEDEEGVNYDLVINNLVVTVDKESHKLIFRTVSLSRATLECDRSTTLDVELVNIGADDEDGVLTIKNTALDLDIEDNFELEEASDEDAVYENSFGIDVGDSVKAGTYKIAALAKYGSKSVSESVDLVVKDCVVTPPEEKEEKEEKEEEVEVITPPEEKEEEEEKEVLPITGEVVLKEKTWIEQNQYVVVLVLAIVVVILLIVWVVTAMKK